MLPSFCSRYGPLAVKRHRATERLHARADNEGACVLYGSMTLQKQNVTRARACMSSDASASERGCCNEATCGELIIS